MVGQRDLRGVVGMSLIPAIVLSSPCSPLSASPSDNLHLMIVRHRRYAHAHSTDA